MAKPESSKAMKQCENEIFNDEFSKSDRKRMMTLQLTTEKPCSGKRDQNFSKERNNNTKSENSAIYTFLQSQLAELGKG